jgi:hypothetical protein
MVMLKMRNGLGVSDAYLCLVVAADSVENRFLGRLNGFERAVDFEQVAPL